MSESCAGKAPRIAVLILAAGSGERTGAAKNKILHPLGGAALIARTAEVFRIHQEIGRILIVGRRRDFAALRKIFAERPPWEKVAPLVEGGRERQDSVRNGLLALESPSCGEEAPEWVLVHDAARPFCSMALLERVLGGLRENPAVVPALPITDTVRRSEGEKSEVVNRAGLFRCQTPQGFQLSLLREAHQKALKDGMNATDDAQLVEALGERLHFVPGDERNFKVTTESDLRTAEQYRNGIA